MSLATPISVQLLINSVANTALPAPLLTLAAILFGILYQGGAWLSFDMPNITREMIVVIQGLVILFAGALEFMCRPMIVRIYQTMTKA